MAVLVNGHEYSQMTKLADTKRNRIKTQRMEAEARRLVLEGRAGELRLEVRPFTSAADTFIEWAKGSPVSIPTVGSDSERA
jgi:hypothetical protein